MAGFVATARTRVAAPPAKVWTALTDPDLIAAYMDGAQVETTWEVGSPITWSGEWKGKPFEDKGEVLAFDEPSLLSMSHYSPMTGEPDEPSSYHTLVYTLTTDGDGTVVGLEQDGCDSEEQAAAFSTNWQGTLDGLKATVEQR
jgi:uncharacterized protein YndB with AHSA1/START domain